MNSHNYFLSKNLTKNFESDHQITYTHKLFSKNTITIQSHSELTSTEFQDYDYYIFFFKDYKKNFFFWESIVFFQKLFLCLSFNIKNIISEDIADIMFDFVLFIYRNLLLNLRPFKILQLNNLDLYSNSSIILSKLLFVIINSERIHKCY